MTNSLQQQLKSVRKRDLSAAAAQAAQRFGDEAVARSAFDIAYTDLELPVGAATVAASRRGLLMISYDSHSRPEVALQRLADNISPRMLEVPDYFDGLRRELDEYFAGKRTSFDLPIDWSLTGGFGRRVLKRTARIAYGDTSTYGTIAAASGAPRGARAAGNALGANPIPIVVPCHRVLHADGGLGGYNGGVDKKQMLLELEGAL